MNVIIEKVNPNDAKEILDFTKKVGAESDNLTFGKEGVSNSVKNSREYIQSMLDNTFNVFLVAKYNEKIIATASYNTFSIYRMSHRGQFSVCVLKEYWNKGVGTMLLKEILVFAKESAKAEIVSLEVRSDNLSAIHLYKKFGFEKIGTFKGYFKIDNEYIDFDIMQIVF